MTGFPYRTRICELLGVPLPIFLAGMGFVSRAELVAAVCEAGGFGVLGAGGLPAEELRAEIQRVRGLTSRPFGVDLWQTDPPRAPGQLEVVLEEKPAALALFSPDRRVPPRRVEEVKRRGIAVLALVRTVAEARAAEAAGVDAVVAHGAEAGGHTADERVGTFALVPQVVDAVQVPVLAGGGIHDGRGLVAALALGASAAWIGTRFISCRESKVHPGFKKALQEANDEDTTITRAYTGLPCRVLKNEFTARWAGRDGEVLPYGEQQRLAGAHVTSGFDAGDRRFGQMPAGQIAGAISDEPTAAELVARIAAEARAVLEEQIYRR